MTTSDLHSLGAVPVRHRVIGLRMEPLTIGHLETLERLGLTLPENISELASAAFVCALPWNQFRRVVSSWMLRPLLWLWRVTVQRWIFEEELRAFHAYLGHGMSGPPVSPPHGASGGCSRSVIPSSRYLRVVLCSRLGCNPDTVRGVTVSEALWDHATLTEIDGRGMVEEQPYEERVAAMEAALPPDGVMIAAARKAHDAMKAARSRV